MGHQPNIVSCPEAGARVDVIIVLGARVGPDGRPSPTLHRRVRRGIALWQEGRAGALLLTGGTPGGGRPEAAVMRDLALAAGVPEERIVLEPTARNTFENASRAAALMRARGWSSALVVTDYLHVPRALLACRAAGIAARGAGIGPVGPVRLLVQGPHEAVGLLWYGLRLLARRLAG